MRLLLDTHFVLAAIEGRLQEDEPKLTALMTRDEVATAVSVASLWEIAIKSRLGRLRLSVPLPEIEGSLIAGGAEVVSVVSRHAFAEISPEPATSDPFDRLLLGVCASEGMRLATLDRALTAHPLALSL
jgi:PIN domain nuclease of toxin-antitoxin system